MILRPAQLLLSALLSATALVTTPEPAARPSAPSAPSAPASSRAYLHSHNLPSDGVAIEGHSPVSYFAGLVARGYTAADAAGPAQETRP